MTPAAGPPVIVIAIGGSADGVNPLRDLVAALPATLPAAVVQDPSEARYPRMPAAALVLDGHRVLRLADLAAAIVRAAAQLMHVAPETTTDTTSAQERRS